MSHGSSLAEEKKKKKTRTFTRAYTAHTDAYSDAHTNVGIRRVISFFFFAPQWQILSRGSRRENTSLENEMREKGKTPTNTTDFHLNIDIIYTLGNIIHIYYVYTVFCFSYI